MVCDTEVLYNIITAVRLFDMWYVTLVSYYFRKYIIILYEYNRLGNYNVKIT